MSLSGAIPSMRVMCAARDDDHVLIGADYKQLELWTMYAITRDEVLGDGLRGGDVYTEDAKFLFSLPAHFQRCKCDDSRCVLPNLHVKPKARQDGKVSHLTFQYWAELNTFYRGLLESDQDMPFSMAALLLSGMRKRYWRTVEWWHEEYERVCARGWSEERILGARKTYPATPEPQAVVNWPNQTTAAVIHGKAWLALGSGRPGRPGALSRFRGEALLVKQWYDAFLIECHKSIKDDVVPVVRAAMEQPHLVEGKEWRFRVDVKTGRHESDV